MSKHKMLMSPTSRAADQKYQWAHPFEIKDEFKK